LRIQNMSTKDGGVKMRENHLKEECTCLYLIGRVSKSQEKTKDAYQH